MGKDRDDKESKVEVAKKGSRHLRGKIKDTLEGDASPFEESDTQLLKFHGVYQQDDRDVRKERRAEGLDRAYIFMVRTAIPGGVLTAEQYLRLDRLAEDYGFGSLRVTTRQGLQFHRVLKGSLKGLITGINDELITTLSACGDVERNVMACPAPLEDEAHVTLRRLSREIAVTLRPKSKAYHEIWFDGDKQLSTDEEEPFYGDRYLPRKFKTGIALDSDNCVDVYNYDAGLIAMVDAGRLTGFNVVVGGGMGMTHNKADTYAALAQPLGFVGPEHAAAAVQAVCAVFRDHGNRADRKHARLKYLLAEWGMERFREEFRRRVDFALEAFRSMPLIPAHDHLGWQRQGGDRYFYGVFVENGRIADGGEAKYKSALRDVVEAHRPGVVLTPHQNVLFTDLPESAREDIERRLAGFGVKSVGQLSAAKRFSMACPALPTCGLALSESERVMPSVTDRLEAELDALGLRDEPITIRMTGCPNGCARPYTADIALVGKGPDNYQIFVGGRLEGDRVADLYVEDVSLDECVGALRPLLKSWATHRHEGEGLGDYYQRLVGHAAPRPHVTGKESATAESIAGKLEV